jgi:hypothetical protein
MAAPTPLLVYGTLQDIATLQDAFEDGTVEFSLCGYGSQIPRVQGTSLLARVTTKPIPVDDNGRFEANLYGNDMIVPAGTFYTLTVMDDNNNVVQCNAYQITGTGSIDMSWAIPYDPNQPPPPLPPLITNLLLVVPWSATPEFPGDEFTTFRITLTGDVTSSTAPDTVQGNLYTFIIQQDDAGSHAFTWPTNFINASPINPQPNSLTVQTFVMGLGDLVPISAATWIGI